MPLGIPHSVFLSWDPDDQDKALAYMRAKLEICQECGTRESEWEEDNDAYIADMRRCRGCEEIAIEQDRVEEISRAGEGSSRGIKVGLIRRKAFELREAAREVARRSTG